MAATRQPWPRRRRAAWLTAIGCSALFVVVYSLTNARAAAAGELGTWFFAWEESIPVVPWMIVPYMSIDLFFVLAPFVCGSVAEIRMLRRRVCTAILAAGALFLLWPLQLGFERPEVDGVFGPVFEFLHGFDQPHNLFPSLHITLIFILRWTYHRHLEGARRWLMHTWFALVTLSTVLTRQHHVIDVVGGFVLALLVFYVFPTGLISRRDVRVAGTPSRRLATVFGIGGAMATASAVATASASVAVSWFLLWIAIALTIVSAGYAGLGPRVFRKYAGYLSLPARAVLGPYLFGLWLTRLWYWRRDPRGPGEIDDVLFGRLPDGPLVDELRDRGVGTVIDLTAEHDASPAVRALQYVNVPMLDLAPPSPEALEEAVAAIERARASGRRVYVHCGLGYGRSAVVVATWLLRTGRAATAREASERVARARGSHATPVDLLATRRRGAGSSSIATWRTRSLPRGGTGEPSCRRWR